MTASRVDIEGWLRELYDNDEYTHMIVACDTFDYDNYPVYVKKDENAMERAEEIRAQQMSAIDEVYSKNYTFEEQMAERRAFHYD